MAERMRCKSFTRAISTRRLKPTPISLASPMRLVDRAVVDFAEQLARRVAEHAARIDDIIGKSSRNWRLERMSRVDRNILRLATCELLHFADTPTRVVLNEAVELAKQFGTAESPAFVNGVVDRIAQLVAAEVPARAAEPTA